LKTRTLQNKEEKQMNRPKMMEDRIMTTREAARLLGVATSTVQYWMDRGRIDSWKTPGGHRRTLESHVRGLMNELAGQPRLQPPASGHPDYVPDPAPGFPVPENEAQRLVAVARTGLMDSDAEERFDRIARLASTMSETPVALVSLMAARRQWIKSGVGWDGRELPRGRGFCTLTILGDAPHVIHDAVFDDRYRRRPLVLDRARIRFYAGLTLRDKDGLALGTLAVMDHVPRTLRPAVLRGLGDLAAIAAEEINKGAG
jgi:excisionase family DNA binding protein